MVKKYRVEERNMGHRYDGGRSSLAQDPVVLSVPEPKGGVLDTSEPFNVGMPNRWSAEVQADYDNILNGCRKDPLSKWCNARLAEWGYSVERIRAMGRRDRMHLCDKLVRAAKREQSDRGDELLRQMLTQPRNPLTPGGHVDKVDSLFGGNGRGGLPMSFHRDGNKQARTALHVRLREWAVGKLVLERPSGSSLHHLMDYDVANSQQALVCRLFQDSQIVLVENDWGAAVPEIDGEWRVPFEFICWEFRVTGVRVLAFTDMGNEPGHMYVVYGADGHWVMDDFKYELGCAALPRGVAWPGSDAQEFRRVAKMCYDTIRASCIMLDAQVADRTHVPAPVKLVERRAKEGRSPLRDHYVVRLLNQDRRAHVVARSAGGGVSVAGARSPQRGHWRKGTWVHYDDPDSGQVKYPNDGGFVVSKTWRRWHFAGDPRNIISKEYRL